MTIFWWILGITGGIIVVYYLTFMFIALFVGEALDDLDKKKKP